MRGSRHAPRVEALPRPPQHVLVDARTVPGVEVPQNMFNKGDGINFTIAAASIIAKTERDRMMELLDHDIQDTVSPRTRATARPSIATRCFALGPRWCTGCRFLSS